MGRVSASKGTVVMSKFPLIGVTTAYSDDRKVKLSPQYIAALLDCGAIPVPLPYTEDARTLSRYAEQFDAFLFSGGVDVDPIRYGEETKFDSVKIDSERDAFELAFFPRVLETGKPIFGICRGSQLINVALGGTLHQNIDGHRQTEDGSLPTHDVTLPEGSRLASILEKTSLPVNSFHHQAVKDVAPSLRAVAYNGGYVEAVESEEHPFLLAVQWHPELMYETCESTKALFRAFVAAALSEKEKNTQKNQL